MRVLIVEDEKNLSRNIATYLSRENYLCDSTDSVPRAMEQIKAVNYDCIVLDMALSDGNWFRILPSLHDHDRGTGVILISAKDSLSDRVDGLNLGADDYLVKPFAFSELNARITAIIRRKRFRGQNLIVSNELVIDLALKTVTVNQLEVDLTRREFDLLLYLVSHKNRVLSKVSLAESISTEAGTAHENFDFVYSHIKNLKRKLAAAGCEDRIRSVYGMGYRFTE
ncbi:MAG TPA: response regulator transcription factor [Puia sp.]|nr:response regulator transcription factor [Puia sp.]